MMGRGTQRIGGGRLSEIRQNRLWQPQRLLEYQNTLVGILGNVSLAKMYHLRGGARDQVTRHLELASNTFIDVKNLTQCMFDLAQDSD